VPGSTHILWGLSHVAVVVLDTGLRPGTLFSTERHGPPTFARVECQIENGSVAVRYRQRRALLQGGYFAKIVAWQRRQWAPLFVTNRTDCVSLARARRSPEECPVGQRFRAASAAWTAQ
jgi:hypothetical protein